MKKELFAELVQSLRQGVRFCAERRGPLVFTSSLIRMSGPSGSTMDCPKVIREPDGNQRSNSAQLGAGEAKA